QSFPPPNYEAGQIEGQAKDQALLRRRLGLVAPPFPALVLALEAQQDRGTSRRPTPRSPPPCSGAGKLEPRGDEALQFAVGGGGFDSEAERGRGGRRGSAPGRRRWFLEAVLQRREDVRRGRGLQRRYARTDLVQIGRGRGGRKFRRDGVGYQEEERESEEIEEHARDKSRERRERSRAEDSKEEEEMQKPEETSEGDSTSREKQRKSLYISRREQPRRSRVRVHSPRAARIEVRRPRSPVEDAKKASSKSARARTKTAKKGGEDDVAKANRLERYAVVKCSYHPQRDFRESMMEMIVERRIRRTEDMEELLACYLTLNSDEHHELIIKVFRQVWFELNQACFDW
ncbi:hypothetical protein EUGRSUZ_D00431, partial [Eucalyptus grandis]